MKKVIIGASSLLIGSFIAWLIVGTSYVGGLLIISMISGYFYGVYTVSLCTILGHKANKNFMDLTGFKSCQRCKARYIGGKWEEK